LEDLVAFLERHGFVAAAEEAAELSAFAGDDAELLSVSVERRLTGEPLAWIIGGVEFCGRWVRVDEGVYVPRWHSEVLVERAVSRLPRAAGSGGGVVIDLCTGSGALGAVLLAAGCERVVGTDLDASSVACARANGVDAVVGDLFAGLPSALRGTADLVVGVVPYVPTGELSLLQRDTFAFETPLAYDGGPDGCAILRRAIVGAAEHLRPAGWLLLELGGDQAQLVTPDLVDAGFTAPTILRDEDGDVRGIEAQLRG
jgi:release factor glutamine methyltransferase